MLSGLIKQQIFFGNSFIYCLIFLALLCLSVNGQKLPFKYYTTADGLGNDRVLGIHQDKKGFLWFATSEGLSRFDGYEFVNYGVHEGLPSQEINDVLEDPQGRKWIVADEGGIALLIDKNNENNTVKFDRFYINEKVSAANEISRILLDSKDNVWCLTAGGVYRATISDNPKFELIKEFSIGVTLSKALFEDRQGSIWFGEGNKLFEARGNEVINHGVIDGDEGDFVSNGLQTKDGRIIILSRTKGVFEFIPSNSAWKKLVDISKNHSNFWSVVETSDNSIWFGGRNVLFRKTADSLTEYSAKQGVGNDNLYTLFEDSEGNLWGGRGILGVFKLPNTAIVSYPFTTEKYSLGISENRGVFKSHFCERNNTLRFALWFCTPKVQDLTTLESEPAQETEEIIPITRNFLVYRENELWGITYDSVRASALKKTVFTFPSGYKIDVKEFFDKPFKQTDNGAFHLDKDNSLWVGKSDGTIYCVSFSQSGERQTEEFQWDEKKHPYLMMNTGQGGLWLFSDGSIKGRLRNGKYEKFQQFENVIINPRSVFLDSRGWLWVGSNDSGIFVFKDPSANEPVFESYKTDAIENGLLSLIVDAITEDNNGKMYFGTARGLSRFDPANGIWNSYTTKDGLTGNYVNGLSKDSQGNIWINTQVGVAKLNPNVERRLAEPPPIYISKIKIAGEEYPISETGDIEIPSILLNSNQNNLTIDFVGLQFRNEDTLKYQYKLEGIDQDWSKPSKSRSVTFASLDSGNYRFQVRAISENGLISLQSAAFQFKISPPIYLHWWFIALFILTISAVVYTFYRLQLQKLLEIERTRTLIATDLHDDIGSNLSKISVMSEVVRLQMESSGKSDTKILSSIADISRESVSSMSDIVWAINPKRDTMKEIIVKMRQHAEETFIPKEISLNFIVPNESSNVKLSMDLRRDFYLTFKEAVNNIVKHSKCSKVKIDLSANSKEVILQIEDDGIGFDVAEAFSGNGLSNMQKRIERIKGTFQIESEPKQGTKIIIRIPQS